MKALVTGLVLSVLICAVNAQFYRLIVDYNAISPPYEFGGPQMSNRMKQGFSAVFTNQTENDLSIFTNFKTPLISNISLLTFGDLPLSIGDSGNFFSVNVSEEYTPVLTPTDDTYTSATLSLYSGAYAICYMNFPGLSSGTITTLGDITGDNISDFSISYENTNYVRSSFLMTGTMFPDVCGFDQVFFGDEMLEFAKVGDVNNDGIDDFVVFNLTMVRVFYGNIRSAWGHANVFIECPEIAFMSVTGGDVNNDNISDIIVTARYGGPYVFVIYGSPNLPEFINPTQDSTAITTITTTNDTYVMTAYGVGNFNGDQYGDILVSLMGISAYEGVTVLAMLYGNGSLGNTVYIDQVQYGEGMIVYSPHNSTLYPQIDMTIAGNFLSNGDDGIVVRLYDTTWPIGGIMYVIQGET